MLGDDQIEGAASQLAEYRKNDTLSEILDRYAVLIEDYRRLKSDYEEERDAREKYKQMAKGQERNPFVLVLVDGDGYIFNDDLVRQGADGGSSAARMLIDAVKASLRRKGLEHCHVMVRIYANVAGLSKALSKNGLAGAEKRSFAPFIGNFNRSYGLADFVDAGELKENADFKLRAMLHLYADNAQCKHIYFAACHDVGYISDLTPHANNSRRFTLVNAPGIRFHDEFSKLGMGIEELPGVFRSTPLDSSAIYRPANSLSASTTSKIATTAAGRTASPAKPTVTTGPSSGIDSQKICDFYRIGKCKYGGGCKFLHPGHHASNSPSWRLSSHEQQSDNTGSLSYGTTNETLQALTLLPKKEEIPEGHVAVNKNNFRLDPYVEPSSPETVSLLMARINVKRICNSYQLNGSCDGRCGYDHSPLDPELKRALESLARSHPCPRKGSCRRDDCNFGHICQNPDCRHRGGKTFCKLPYASHNEDLVVADYVPVATRPPHRRQVSLFNNSTAGGSDNEDGSQSTGQSPPDNDDEQNGYDLIRSNAALVEADGSPR
jgi:hypothetical protein